MAKSDPVPGYQRYCARVYVDGQLHMVDNDCWAYSRRGAIEAVRTAFLTPRSPEELAAMDPIQRSIAEMVEKANVKLRLKKNVTYDARRTARNKTRRAHG